MITRAELALTTWVSSVNSRFKMVDSMALQLSQNRGVFM